MDEKSKAEINYHYSQILLKHGPTIEVVGDISHDTGEPLLLSSSHILSTSKKRYATLAAIEPIRHDSSVLDIGCALGFLCDFLRKAGWQGKYTGVDFNPDMIEAAKERLPDEEFICVDILTDGFTQQSDYVFCGAAVQCKPKFADPDEYLHDMIRKMFSLAKKGLAFDIFSTNVDYRHEDKLYTDPVDLLDFCYSLTKRITFRADYRPFEFIVYLFVDESRDEYNIYDSWQTPELKIVQG